MKMKLGKRFPCEVEHYPYPMSAPFVLVEQVNEQGNIFTDKHLHPQCEYIRIVKKDGTVTN
jgi:hypothetical protein